jgi:hypothetical protein
MMEPQSAILDSWHRHSGHGDGGDLRSWHEKDARNDPDDAADDHDINSVSSHREPDGVSVSSTTVTKTMASNKETALITDETKAVRRLRILMLLTILCITITISVLVWYFLSEGEKEEFQQEFDAQGMKLLSGFRDDSYQKMQALNSLSTSLTNYALAANLTWSVFIPID